MSQTLNPIHAELDENPYVTFDKDGNGVSRVFDLEWDFSTLNQSQSTMPFGKSYSKYRKGIQSYLYAVMEWQKENSPSGMHQAVGTLDVLKCQLKKFSVLLGSADFSLLSSDREWEKFSRKLDGYGTIYACRRIRNAINLLNKANLIKRYVGREMEKWVKQNSAEIVQAQALPDAIHAKILQHVRDFIEEYHPYRHQISEAMAKLYDHSDDLLNLKLKEFKVNNLCEMNHQQRQSFTYLVSRHQIKVTSLRNFKVGMDGTDLRELLKNCFICVGLFSGARHKELLSMNKYSYEVNEKTGICTVSGFSTKGNNGNRIYTTWNTAPIVKLALELAYDATQATRSYKKNRIESAYKEGSINQGQYNIKNQDLESAFISCSMPTDRSEIHKKNRFLNNFSVSGIEAALRIKDLNIFATKEDVDEYNILNPGRIGKLKVGGSLPKFSPHDLRRTFVVFMVKNRLGNNFTVKFQLKHGNCNMSKWYSNYAELSRTRNLLMDRSLMDEYNSLIEDSVVDAWDDIYNLSDNLSGEEGNRIAKLKENKLEKGEQVLMSRSELRALVQSGDKSIVLLPTGGYCTNRDCERLCSLIDIVEAPCKHKIITDKTAKRLAKERDGLILSFREIAKMCDPSYTLILDGRKKKIQSIEPTLDAHGIKYEQFNDRITDVVYGH